MGGRKGSEGVTWSLPENGEPRAAVLLVHGITGGPAYLGVLARRLRAMGFATAAPGWHAKAHDIADMAQEVASFFGTAPVGMPLHIVGHSMGGLSARAALDRHPPSRLGRLVTLGSPHRGTLMADIGAKLGVRRFGRPASSEERRLYHLTAGEPAYGFATVGAAIVPGLIRHDGTIELSSTRAPGAHEHLEVFGTHLSMLLSRRMAQRIANFLDGGSLADATRRAA